MVDLAPVVPTVPSATVPFSAKVESVPHSRTIATEVESSPKDVTVVVTSFDVKSGMPTETLPAGGSRTTTGVNFTGSVHWS